MWVVQGIPDDAVLDGEAVAEFRRREDDVADFASVFRLEEADRFLELLLVQVVSHDNEIRRTRVVADKDT